MPGAGDHPQRRPEAPCILERVVDRHLRIARAPDEHRWAVARGRGRREDPPRRVPPRRSQYPCAVRALRATRRSPWARSRRRPAWPSSPTPQLAEVGTARSSRGRGDQPAWLNERADRERVAGSPRRRTDPRGRDQHQATDELRAPHRQAESDDAAERMPNQDGWMSALAFEQERHAVGERPRFGSAGKGEEPPWPGRSGTITR